MTNLELSKKIWKHRGPVLVPVNIGKGEVMLRVYKVELSKWLRQKPGDEATLEATVVNDGDLHLTPYE